MKTDRNLPDGWEWKKLGDVIHTISAGKKKLKTDEYENTGDLAIIDQSQNSISGYTNEKSRCIECDLPVVIFGDHTKVVKYIDFPFAIGADGTKILTSDKPDINLKYLYYIMGAIKYPYEGYARFFKYLKETTVPIPPLDTQQRIVDLLDSMEELQSLRKETLDVSDQLIQSVFLEKFGDPVKNPKGWEIKTLGEFGDIVTGNTPSKKCSEYYGDFVEWVKSDNINSDFMYLTEAKEKLSELGAKVGRTAPERSVLVTCIAGSLSCIGNVSVTNREVAFNQQINAIIPYDSTNELFLYHLISYSKEYIQHHSTQSMKGMVSKSNFSSIKMIYPPFYLQQQFADFVQSVEDMKSSQVKSAETMDEMFNSFLDKAFRGELVC
ncbi:restriction endonuclease subunit S [Methanohalophilus portucalensis]|uniref:Restriction endonuclease subunit S n=2 Tax=Methanohalophilus portucalensis TaxID=39664 RepID=A0A1L9C5I4_9EURY|nr:restriction endonuclease subunit S [Methanohalophilus portucalensis]ATU08341.1 hypothetical protein BKM01_05880 [Methanohalophilus portucalensis]OJH49668.1 restriction modification system DNA specificity domain protein [Methanohalophilus portucalensis FDF-1]RNI13495.1 restriction endonuclease subunit S [Methanohalophilus portucalensis FDF-1]SMH34713.1 type I restriction enzyme, S subunit [Methanohalophilus portucalensis FDF-1]